VREPVLEVGDIQGHVLTGFGRAFELLLGLRIVAGSEAQARRALAPLCDRITSAAATGAYKAERRRALATGRSPPTLGGVAIAIAFSAEGLRVLGEDPRAIPDLIFVGGAGADAGSLGDALDATGHPLHWQFGATPETDLHILVIVASGDHALAEAEADRLLDALGVHVSLVYRECGARIANDGEHFGFADGVSQPGFRGLLPDGTPLISRSYPPDHPFARVWAKPGQRLTWPGQFVFGYAGLDPDDLAAPGEETGGGAPLLRNGSLLVLRRLTQDVAAFWTAMEDLAAQLKSLTGRSWEPVEAAARCVGRWPDGTPLSLSPAGEDSKISGDPYRRNGFNYVRAVAPATLLDQYGEHGFPGAAADPLGRACPLFAHVRKVNPRDHAHDFGGVGASLRSQMLRRGIPFGPRWTGEDDGRERGLLFMSYQTSVQSQFRKLMTEWVKDPVQPLGGGVDPLLGPDRPEGRRLVLEVEGSRVTLALRGSFVRATGASYLFAPGIATVRRLLVS